MTTWVEGARDSGYDVTHLPYGVFSHNGDEPRVGARIGDFVVDLAPIAAAEMRREGHVLESATLNAFMALGRPAWRTVRSWLVATLTDEAAKPDLEPFLFPLADVRMHMPFEVADYVDFYCSLDHASNVGKMFRPDAEPLLPNWRHLPVGYHGRAGTVVPTGTDVRRPCGQRKAPQDAAPTFGPSQRLDIEAELGFVVGTPSRMGTPVSIDDFAEHVFGVVLLNDWSARDIQAWEYVPLGPFLGKSFATSISAWVTPLDALEAARVPLPRQDPTPLDYLRGTDDAGLDIDYEVQWNGTVVARPPYRSMYWSPAQMLAHMTVNGASLRTGDLFGSGTISGPEKEQRGSFLELSWSGQEPITLADGSRRTFLEDGDEIVLTATAPGTSGAPITLGEVAGRILPAG
jgi:fumarylacetoacetase